MNREIIHEFLFSTGQADYRIYKEEKVLLSFYLKWAQLA
jgi:hypothetical protein